MRPSLKTLFILGALAAPAAMPAAFAAGTPLMADHAMSAKRLMGMVVYNDINRPWGVIEDVIVPPSGDPMAIVSVDKMVGHAKMVAVPLSHIAMGKGDHMMMAGATKEMAEKLPAFAYTAGAG